MTGRADAETLRTILDRLPGLVAYWDAEQRNVVANAAYVDYFGLDPEHMHGILIRDLLGAEVYAASSHHVEGALDGVPQLFNREITDPSGATRYTQVSYTPDVVDGRVRGFVTLVTDITGRRTTELRLEDSERQFRTLFDAAPVGVFLLSREAKITDLNPAAVQVLGRSREELIGKESADLTHPEDIALTRSRFADLIEGRIDQYRLEKRFIHSDGHIVWAQVDARLLRSGPGGQLQVLGQVQDISERRLQREMLEAVAVSDLLTGLLNRRGFMDALELELARCKRYGKVAALLMCDLDNFKAVNDTLGHQAGDEVLARLGELLRDSLRVTDTAGRYGGDEFVVLIPEATASGAAIIRDKLEERIGAAGLGSADLPISASIGLSLSRSGDTGSTLLSRADRGMYDAKAGRQGAL